MVGWLVDWLFAICLSVRLSESLRLLAEGCDLEADAWVDAAEQSNPFHPDHLEVDALVDAAEQSNFGSVDSSSCSSSSNRSRSKINSSSKSSGRAKVNTNCDDHGFPGHQG